MGLAPRARFAATGAPIAEGAQKFDLGGKVVMSDTTKNPLQELVDDTKNAINDILGYLDWAEEEI
jgi:hypothetical protein